MERRGRIPIAKFRTPDGKPRSRSRARDPIVSDPEMDMFTLLEENSALKEDKKDLNIKISEYVENIKSLENENLKLRVQIKNLNDKKPEKFIEITGIPQMFEEPALPGMTSNIKKYSSYTSVTKKQTKEEFIKMFSNTCATEFETLIDFHGEADVVPFKCIQNLLDEFSQLRANLNSIELQLYEANEKIAELMEYQTLLEEENKTMKNSTSSNSKDKSMPEQNGSHIGGPQLKIPEQASPKCFTPAQEHVTEKRNSGNDTSCGERIVEVVLTL